MPTPQSLLGMVWIAVVVTQGIHRAAPAYLGQRRKGGEFY